MPTTYNLATDIGKLRLAIGDNILTSRRGVKPDGTNFLDEELQVFLDEEGTVGRAAAAACEALQAAWAVYTDIFVGGRAGRSEYLSKVTTAWGAKAVLLRKKYGGGARVTSTPLSRTDGYHEAVLSGELNPEG